MYNGTTYHKLLLLALLGVATACTRTFDCTCTNETIRTATGELVNSSTIHTNLETFSRSDADDVCRNNNYTYNYDTIQIELRCQLTR